MRVLLATLAFLVFTGPAPAEWMYGATCNSLFRFDSDSPGTVYGSVPVFEDPDTCLHSLDVDQPSGVLYGAWYWYNCPILCPPLPTGIVALDPTTGAVQYLWNAPGYPSPFRVDGEFDVDPGSGEIRLIDSQVGTNFRVDPHTGTATLDSPIFPFREVLVIAQAPGHDPGTGSDTFAIAYRPGPPSGFDLVRIGGPGGVPPASTGALTVLAPVDLPATSWPTGFDISPSGVAYVSAIVFPAASPAVALGGEGTDPAHLYTLDLVTGAATDRGVLGPPGGFSTTGIAVVGRAGVTVIPALDGVGLLFLALLLLLVAGKRLEALRDR